MDSEIIYDDPCTPAHKAVELGNYEELTRLLHAGGDPNEVCCGMTLLVHAIDLEGDSSLQSGNPVNGVATAIILAFGANPELIAPIGYTPLQVADSYGHEMARSLIVCNIRSAV